MATVTNVSAQSSFSSVKSRFVADAHPILNMLQEIARNSSNAVRDTTYLGNSVLDVVNGPSAVPSIGAPSEPTTDETFTRAIAYLDWLESQLPAVSDFPTYGQLIGEPPAAPAVDTDEIEGRLQINTVPTPDYSVPEWDESVAWTGDDALNDAANSAIIAPFVYTEPVYLSPFLDDNGDNLLYAFIKREIESGDFGLDPDDEDRLFERAREREARAMNGAIDNALRLYSSGGFSMPTGAAMAAVARAQTEMRDKVASLSREIAIKKADLYLEAKKIALTLGLALDKETMAFHNATADRLLKRIVEEITATIAVATANLERIKAFIAKYEAFARAFEARVKATTSVVDLYKAQVEAEGVKAQVNRSLVEEFVARNRAVIDTFLAQMKGFESVVDGRVRYHGVLSDVFKAKSTEIEYRSRAVQGAFDLAERQQKNLIDFRVGKYNAEINAAKLTLDKVSEALRLKIEQIKTQVQGMATLAAGAMSGLNVNLGLSVSGAAAVQGSESVSESEDKSAGVTRRSISESESDDYSESHIYNEN